MTRPSSQRASAIFSLVASAWKSTITTARLRARLLDELVDDLERALRSRGRASPSRLITATGVPSRAGATASARPGARRERFAGRMTRSVPARYGAELLPRPGVVAERDHVGPGGEHPLGELRREPAPSAAFSPFTTQKSAPSSSRRPGSRASTARRPGAPKTSAMKRILRDAECSVGRAGWTSIEHVVARVLRVARERLALDAREVEHACRPSSGAAVTRDADRERRVAAAAASARRRATARRSAGCRRARRSRAPLST